MLSFSQRIEYWAPVVTHLENLEQRISMMIHNKQGLNVLWSFGCPCFVIRSNKYLVDGISHFYSIYQEMSIQLVIALHLARGKEDLLIHSVSKKLVEIWKISVIFQVGKIMLWLFLPPRFMVGVTILVDNWAFPKKKSMKSPQSYLFLTATSVMQVTNVHFSPLRREFTLQEETTMEG